MLCRHSIRYRDIPRETKVVDLEEDERGFCVDLATRLCDTGQVPDRFEGSRIRPQESFAMPATWANRTDCGHGIPGTFLGTEVIFEPGAISEVFEPDAISS